MNSPVRKALRWSLGLHVLLLLVLILVPALLRRRTPRPPREITTFVELRAAAAEPPRPVPAEAVRPPPDPPPVEPAPPPRDIPETPPPRRRIQVSTQRVVRSTAPAARPPPDAARLRELLDPGPAVAAGGGAAADSLPAWYYDQVRRRLYEAWEQPGGLPAGQSAQVRLRVERDGRIARSDLSRSSGAAAMDESVLRAVRATPALPPLPPSFRKQQADITVTFELSGGPGGGIR